MSEMVERVALALRKHDVSGTVSRVLARAAIEAMRDPTKAMAHAGSQTNYGYGSCAPGRAPTTRDVWADMIDAALAPAESSQHVSE
jgi:hypothetical protein